MVQENINTELYPIAEQASRIIEHMARTPYVETDSIFAAMVGGVSDQQVATEEQGFVHRTVASPDSLMRVSV
jgi:hypothetical protein